MDLVCPQLIALLVHHERVKGVGWIINFLSLLVFTVCLGAPYQLPILGDMLIVRLFLATCTCIGTFALGLAASDQWVEARTYHALLQLQPSKKHVVTVMGAESLISLPYTQYNALKRYLETF
ncbi:hypothetical protein ACYVLC_000522 [Vibrio cholerae]|uniref:hypothetical protein n=1 Tax=Vibrio cholerae TaxID=666 RepID=UPI000BA943BF|nr:hypothetical protein [Vibrio cholerae]EGQ9577895.1 hypothetical protein [Vibrio cholerae]EGR5010050.1 hypothetical protein [Vibrio cholerae]EID7714256.1 hypothetical protein [Vibrio cholerae]EJF7195994.1 hypothetical protein [Vibrio cholerae]EJL6682589.1 hypothetical protein [Vibrio cholerae]